MGDFFGTVRLTRRFGYPGQIDDHERVWLLLDGAEAADVAVNGLALARGGNGGEFDVTPLLLPRNELTIQWDLSPDRPDVWGEAALEVRARAYLRGLTVVTEKANVQVHGTVAGVEPNLELYLVADRRPVAYAVVPPDGGSGEYAFTLSTNRWHEDGSPVVSLRVELIRGAVVWYRFEGAA